MDEFLCTPEAEHNRYLRLWFSLDLSSLCRSCDFCDDCSWDCADRSLYVQAFMMYADFRSFLDTNQPVSICPPSLYLWNLLTTLVYSWSTIYSLPLISDCACCSKYMRTMSYTIHLDLFALRKAIAYCSSAQVSTDHSQDTAPAIFSWPTFVE